MESRLIFVGGAPRSGTTLVQNMLDCHPEILGGPEFLHIPDIIALGEKLHGSVERGWISLFCSAEEIDERMRTLILDFLLPLLERSGKRILSEKTPGDVLVFPKLVDLFPDARFVHVVRDPRGTVASLLEVGRRGRESGHPPVRYTTNVPVATKYVRRCLDAGFTAERAAPGRVIRVGYESLVQQPGRELRRLCRFLDVDWDSRMERPGEQAHMGAEAITVNSQGVWYDVETYYSNPHTDSIDKWRGLLTALQEVTINRAFRDCSELKDLGYVFRDPEVEWADMAARRMRLAMRAGRAAWRRALNRPL